MTEMNGQPGRPVPSREGAGIPEVQDALARLRAAPNLPQLLAEAFDGFEVIRLLARGSENREPGLLAVFMTAADAAVDGREAITVAPSLPAGRSRVAAVVSACGAGLSEIADALTGLGGVLHECLTVSAANAVLPGNRTACMEAARAAQRISQLMARGGDDGHLR